MTRQVQILNGYPEKKAHLEGPGKDGRMELKKLWSGEGGFRKLEGFGTRCKARWRDILMTAKTLTESSYTSKDEKYKIINKPIKINIKIQ